VFSPCILYILFWHLTKCDRNIVPYMSLRFAEAAAANPKCMNNVQQVHDFVVRESLSRNSGFEIGTQGDAFECAFVSVVDAVNFALEVQTRLHNANWPKDVLSLPGWGSVTNMEGDVMLRGPRVRIGVHLALCGEWVRYTHRLTRQHIFNGPGYDIAAVISDAANGGQTLLTRVTLDALLPRMRAARFPVVQPVGVFTWPGLETPIELFSVQPIGSPQNPLRVFTAPLRKIEMVGPAEGLSVIQPPAGRERALQNEPGFTWVDVPTARAPISFVAFELKNAAPLLNDSASVALLQEKLEICAAQVATQPKCMQPDL
jgi:class 3 adenylate cyclase